MKSKKSSRKLQHATDKITNLRVFSTIIESRNKLKILTQQKTIQEIKSLEKKVSTSLVRLQKDKFEVNPNPVNPKTSFFALDGRFRKQLHKKNRSMASLKQIKVSINKSTAEMTETKQQKEDRVINLKQSGLILKNFLGGKNIDFFQKLVKDNEIANQQKIPIDNYDKLKHDQRQATLNEIDLLVVLQGNQALSGLIRSEFLEQICSTDRLKHLIKSKYQFEKPLEMCLDIIIDNLSRSEVFFDMLYKELNSKKNSVYVKMSQDNKPFLEKYRLLLVNLLNMFKLPRPTEIQYSHLEKKNIMEFINLNKNYLKAALDISQGTNFVGIIDLMEAEFQRYSMKFEEQELKIKLLEENNQNLQVLLTKQSKVLEKNHTSKLLEINHELIDRVKNPKKVDRGQLTSKQQTVRAIKQF